MPINLFIPDLHADREAAETTLTEAGVTHREGTSLHFTDLDFDEITFTGDYIDRGPDNLGTLDLLLQVRDECKSVTFELGNHDMTALHVLTHPREPQWMRLWSDGIPVLHEVAQKFHLQLKDPVTDGHPLSDHKLPDDEITEDYLTFWKKYMEGNPDMQNTDFPAAFAKLHELFFKGPFSVLFQQMKIAHRVGGILAVHAGMNQEGLAEGIEGLNALYQNAWKNKDFRSLFDYDWKNRKPVENAPLASVICMMKPLPPDTTPLIAEATAKQMQAEGMPVMIHGHAVLLAKEFGDRRGVQQCNNAFGVADMNGDIGMSRGFTVKQELQKSSDWGYIQHDTTSGQITANNPITGPLDFGVLKDGEYRFPSID